MQKFYETPEEVDYEELSFCIDMENGKMVLLHVDLKVEKIIGELIIKER